MDGVNVTVIVCVLTSLVGMGDKLGVSDTDTDEVPE